MLYDAGLFLLYNVTQLYVHIYLLPLELLPTLCTLLGHHRALSRAACAAQQLATGWLVYAWEYIYVSATLSTDSIVFLPNCTPQSLFFVSVSLFLPCKACLNMALKHLPLMLISKFHNFPGGSDGKVSAYNAGDPSSIPGSGRSPGEGNGNPLKYSCLENPMDGAAWLATVNGVAKSLTGLSDFTIYLSILLICSISQKNFLN